MTEVSVVSGTYNRRELVEEMVKSARQSAGSLDLEIVLVDGGSTDGTIEWARSQPDVTLIEQGELLGAIKAYNAGCEVAQGRYVVIGNDDITFSGDTIQRAWNYLQENPEVGQVAFGHRYQRRGSGDKPVVQGAYGYHYGQCSMLPRWLGDAAGWWGDEGMRTYGGDTRLSLRLWEMGWPVVPVEGCAVIDREHEDELREINSDSPWKHARANNKIHPDLDTFTRAWQKRVAPRPDWIPAPSKRIVRKAMAGTLRSMRFKSGMYVGSPTRTALIDALAKFGPTEQVNQTDLIHETGREGFQEAAKEAIRRFEPDLVIWQAQRENNILPQTVRALRKARPWMFQINWDGDTHYPLTEFHFDIARSVHLQLIVSPSWFAEYAKRGIGVGYWPIGIEQEYLDQERATVLDGPDVLFLGALYGEGVFPEAEFRRDAVLALSKSGLRFDLYGPGWPRVGLETKSTSEKHGTSAEMMSRAKMTLSISQSADLWGYTSDRLYNICATGCPALVQRFAGMEQHGFVDGVTCIAFETIEEMLEKARYYLHQDVKRESIGAAGREMTHRRHTWERRLDGLWAMLEGIP